MCKITDAAPGVRPSSCASPLPCTPGQGCGSARRHRAFTRAAYRDGHERHGRPRPHHARSLAPRTHPPPRRRRLGAVGLGLGGVQRRGHDLRLRRLLDQLQLRARGHRRGAARLGPRRRRPADRPPRPHHRAALGHLRSAEALARGEHLPGGRPHRRDVLRATRSVVPLARAVPPRRGQRLLRVRRRQLQRDALPGLHTPLDRAGQRLRLGHGLHRRDRAAADRLLRLHPGPLRRPRRGRPARAHRDDRVRGVVRTVRPPGPLRRARVPRGRRAPREGGLLRLLRAARPRRRTPVARITTDGVVPPRQRRVPRRARGRLHLRRCARCIRLRLLAGRGDPLRHRGERRRGHLDDRRGRAR